MRTTRRRPGATPTAAPEPTDPAESTDLDTAIATLDHQAGTAPPPPAPARAARTRPFTRAAPSADSIPAVNLLSPWVLEQLTVHRLRRRFAYGLLAVVVVVALGFGALAMRLDDARTALAEEQAVGTNLSTQIADLAPVRTYVGAVDTRVSSVVDALDGELAFSRMLGGLQAALPPRASLDSLAVTLPPTAALGTGTADVAAVDPAAATCPGPDPFAARAVVGCLQITGTAGSRDAVSTLVLRLGRNPLFAEPFITTTTTGADESGRGVSFSGSVGLTELVGNPRYVDLLERLGSDRVAAAAKAAREAEEAASAESESGPEDGAADADGAVRSAVPPTDPTEEQP